ncbi:enoyl-CoA hydratase/isomerase family protein [Paraburkholderia acidisoli]|nr:enoyl-CoA hydratase/isomerase family protein [Paraburkholderia acidisoli]
MIERYATHWTLVLDRPGKRNALSAELVEALLDAFDTAAREAVPVVVLRGHGHCFSAGFDMSEAATQSDGDLLLRFVRIEMLLNRIATSPCATVAVAHGRNFGAGVDLFAACRVRIAAPGTTFQMPGLRFGIVLGTARFARIVGRDVARAMLETSAPFDVDWAVEHGFAERGEPAPRLLETIDARVARVATLAPRTRRLLDEALCDERADADLAMLVRSAAEPGLRERIAAYRATTAPPRPASATHEAAHAAGSRHDVS